MQFMATCDPKLPGEMHPALAGRRILVVDPEKTVWESARMILAPVNCAVDATESGEQARDLIRRLSPGEHFDAILAALILPDMSGLDLYLKLKQQLEDVPLALVCGFGFDPGPLIAKARHAGVQASLLKPFRRDQLLRTIEQVVGATR
jgi:two-component system, sensor histidine kinase SagS